MTDHHDLPDFAGVPSGDVVAVNTFSRALRYRPIWPVLLGLLGLAAGLFLGSTRTQTYAATATVEIGQGLIGVNTNGLGQGAGITAETEAQVASSTSVAAQVQRKLHSSQSVKQLLKRVKIGTPANANALTVTFTGDSRRAAQAGANAFAQAYIAVRAGQLRAILARSQANLQSQYADLTQRAATSSKPTAALRSQQNGLAAELAQLSSVVVDPGVILSSAQLPTGHSGIPMLAFPVGGAGIGFLLGWVIAVARERRVNPVRRATDVEALGLPVLGVQGPKNATEEISARLAVLLRTHPLRQISLSEPVKAEPIRDALVEGLQACGVQVASAQGTGSVSTDASVSARPTGVGWAGHVTQLSQRQEAEASIGRQRVPETYGDRAVGDDSTEAIHVERWFRPGAALETESSGPSLRRIEPTGVSVTSIPSLFTSAKGLVSAAESDGVVLCCERKRTRVAALTHTVADLRAADVRLLGVILL